MSKKKLSKCIIYFLLLAAAVCTGHFSADYWLRNVAFSDTMPSKLAMERVADTGIDGIYKLWNTKSLPQRFFVIDRVLHLWYEKKNLREKLSPLLRQFLNSGIMRGVACGTRLTGYTQADDLPYVLPLLKDPDPVIRMLAAKSLLRGGTKKYAPFIVKLLDDSDEQLRITATAILRRWYKQDFGVRWNGEKKTIEKGIGLWRHWAQKKKTIIAASSVKPELAECEASLAPDFEIDALNGKSFNLSSVTSPFMMLYFWGKPEHDEVPVMRYIGNLKEKYQKVLKIIPINVDAVPTVHLGHKESHCDHQEACSHKYNIYEIIRKRWSTYGFGGQCLIDNGDASFRYITNHLPTTVIIRNGSVQRHFTGQRTFAELTAIIDEILKQ